MTMLLRVAENCNGAIAQMLDKWLLDGRGRSRIWQCVVPRTRKFLSERQNLHDYLEREARRALQGECKAQRRFSEAEMERCRMVGKEEILIGWLCVETNGQLESQKTELHHANHWDCQTHMESCRMFEELTTKKDFVKRIMHWIAWKLRNHGEFVGKRRKELDS